MGVGGVGVSVLGTEQKQILPAGLQGMAGNGRNLRGKMLQGTAVCREEGSWATGTPLLPSCESTDYSSGRAGLGSTLQLLFLCTACHILWGFVQGARAVPWASS